ncbi:MAG: patatin family protein [Clostridia bacterium]|nr:patatin family protein [Clostridia bacterium]
MCIGVSAGSANIASFLGGQKGRNYLFYTEYSMRKEYMGLNCLFKCGSFINLNYVYRTLSNSDGENPLNYRGITENKSEYTVVATDSKTGRARYFTKNDMRENDYGILVASCTIPAVCRPARVCGGVFHDGGIADPVPVDFALQNGCDRLVVILTRPRDYVLDTGLDLKAARLLRLRYPNVSRGLCERKELYAKSVEKAKALEAQGKCLIIAPDDCCGLETLTKDAKKLDRLYKKGYADGARIAEFVFSRK